MAHVIQSVRPTWINLHILMSIEFEFESHLQNIFIAISRLVFDWITRSWESWGVILKLCLSKLNNYVSAPSFVNEYNINIYLIRSFWHLNITVYVKHLEHHLSQARHSVPISYNYYYQYYGQWHLFFPLQTYFCSGTSLAQCNSS